jgi:Zn-dependent protease
MGHVLAGRLFGRDAHIVLYSFGGLAIGSTDLPRRWQRVIVLLAGPGSQLALFGLIYAFVRFGSNWLDFDRMPDAAWSVLSFLWQINLYWALLNLLPIWPLDGGQVTRQIAESVSPTNGLRFSLGLSLFTAGLLAVHSISASYGKPILPIKIGGSTYTTILFALLALSSYQALQQIRYQPRRYDYDANPWERDPDYWR